MKKCVLEFCHSNKASWIDSNSYQIFDVVLPNGNTEKHVGKLWSVLTVDEQYTLFKKYKKQFKNTDLFMKTKDSKFHHAPFFTNINVHVFVPQ